MLKRWIFHIGIGLVGLGVASCTAPTYLTVPATLPTDQQYRGLSPSLPGQALLRDQHLGQLREDMHYQEESVLRAEQQRLEACRAPGASQVDSLAYQRCQLKDQLHEQRRAAAAARERYLRAMSGRGGGPS